MEITKHKEGTALYFKHNGLKCVVVLNQLGPGGVNVDDALLIVETQTRILMPVPVAKQDEYLTTVKPKLSVWKRVTAGKISLF